MDHDGILMVIRSCDIITLVEKIKGPRQKPKNPDSIRSQALTDAFVCTERMNRCNITEHGSRRTYRAGSRKDTLPENRATGEPKWTETNKGATGAFALRFTAWLLPGCLRQSKA